MTTYTCHGCGMQYPDNPEPPGHCVVCTDDRQYVAWGGHAWTTSANLALDHTVRLEPDSDLLGIGNTPAFAIPQRALLIQTDASNIKWDCISLVTPDAVAAIERKGGLDLNILGDGRAVLDRSFDR